MENEDSTKALFCDPNAYIHHKPQKKDPPKKVVFAEPYECLPSYYIDNNFKKGDCDCVKCHKPEKPPECKPEKSKGFDIKSLLPIFSLLGGNGGGEFSSLVSMLSPKANNEQGNPLNMISSLLSNSGGLNNILNIFKPKESKEKRPLKTTDFEIKNYTRVE